MAPNVSPTPIATWTSLRSTAFRCGLAASASAQAKLVSLTSDSTLTVCYWWPRPGKGRWAAPTHHRFDDASAKMLRRVAQDARRRLIYQPLHSGCLGGLDGVEPVLGVGFGGLDRGARKDRLAVR